MKKLTFIIALMFGGFSLTQAQNDYFVKTAAPQVVIDSEEERFIMENFPLIRLCDWTEGMKFMVIPNTQDMIVGTFKNYATKKTINNSDIKYKIFEFLGIEEDTEKGYIRIIFNCEENKYYSEFRAKDLETFCSSKAKQDIKTLAYLGDIDAARNLLPGKTLFLNTETVKVDDPNSFSGSREVKVPKNLRVTVTEVGVGSNKAYPVKVVFKDANNKSYFLEVALSKTNSGMDISDYAAANRDKYFPNAFTFNDPMLKHLEALEAEYANKDVYPIVQLEVDALVKHDDMMIRTRIEIPRYTPLVISAVTKEEHNPLYTLVFRDHIGTQYSVDVTFKSENVVLEKNFFHEMFAFGNVKARYPQITEESWALIAQGQTKKGMSKDECRLALGEPNLVRKKGANQEFEEWIYQDRLLNFEKGILTRSTK